MPDRQIVIVGGGRHAVEAFYLLEDIGESDSVVAFAQDVVEPGKSLLNLPVITVEEVLSNPMNGLHPLLLGAIGDIQSNKRLVELFNSKGFEFLSAIAKQVPQHRQKHLGKGITISQGTVLTTNVTVGDHSMINIGCTLSHDVMVGKFVNISPGVHLAGYAKIEDEVFIGTGATVIPHVTVGKGCYMAAGACVTKDIPPYSMAAGVPAVVKKSLNGRS